MPGPAPKTVAEHKRNGTYRADRHGDLLAGRFEGGTPEKPSDLRHDASRLWDDIVAKFPPESLATLDWAALEACCRAYSIAAGFRESLENDPTQLKVVDAWAKAERLFLSYAGRFGLTPLDRNRLRVPPKENKDDDPMTALLKITAKRTG